MFVPANGDRSELQGVVLAAQRGCGKQKAQNLRIGLSSPTSKNVKHQENQYSAKQAVEQVERARTKAHGEKEQLSLGTENREGPGERTMNQVDPSCVRHGCSSDSGFRSPISRKEPGHEVDGSDGHANAKQDAGKHAL